MKPDDPRHGTNAGYEAHKKQGEAACEPCKQGKAEYIAKWRAATDRDWLAQKYARDRALQALARLHPVDFERLFVAERVKDRRHAAGQREVDSGA